MFYTKKVLKLSALWSYTETRKFAIKTVHQSRGQLKAINDFPEEKIRTNSCQHTNTIIHVMIRHTEMKCQNACETVCQTACFVQRRLWNLSYKKSIKLAYYGTGWSCKYKHVWNSYHVFNRSYYGSTQMLWSRKNVNKVRCSVKTRKIVQNM